MTVFVAHAPADREAAESLESYVERRGHFVELDDGQTALRPIAPTDVLALLCSEQLLAAPERTRLEQRALDAWAADRLVIVRLDKAEPPVGLRDLPAIDREGEDWPAAVQAVQQALSLTAKPTPAGGRARSAWPATLGLIAGVLVGLGALWVIAALWLVNRIGPTPGGWPELRAGLDAFALRFGIPFGALLFPALAAIGLASAVWLVVGLMGRRGRRRGQAAVALYADADSARLAPLMEAAARAKVRLVKPAARDFSSVAELVTPASRCVVFCSPAAFADDGLRRTLYAVDRIGAKPAPIYLSAEPPPQDFAHFLAGAGGVKLYETPEPQMAQALLRALGVPA